MNTTIVSSLRLGIAFLICAILAFVGHWTINRVYVPRGYSLLLKYKGALFLGTNKEPPPERLGRYSEGEIGYQEVMPGPGRHFFCPIWWEWELVPDQIVKPGELAIVTSKLGNPLPGDQFLVDGDIGSTTHKGILRKTLGPGRYRVNPYAYDFTTIRTEMSEDSRQRKFSGWVELPPGYVGVVTNLADNPATGATVGVQDKVLQPGLYVVNPKEQQIDIVKIGYRETSVVVTKKTNAQGDFLFDEAGEPLISDTATGINFPSSDGFPIHMDFTAIWGIMPDQAAECVRRFGTVDNVEQRFVLPQIESICRNQGSTKGAVELLVGESRQQFQDDVSLEFSSILEEKHVRLLYGLIRHIYIPTDVRAPIQAKNIAVELTLTRDAEQETAKAEGALREAERKVEFELNRVKVETEKLAAQAIAEGEKKAEEIKAQTIKLVAAIDKETAESEAEAQVVIGQARGEAEKLLQEAKADKFRLAVEAFGSGEAYNQWVFATALPDDIKLNLLYAGQGTFWTDLNNFLPAMIGKQVQDGAIAPGANLRTPAK